MRLLLDEDVPLQLLDPIRHLLRGHTVDHVDELGWKGKKDRFLLPDARRKGYDALVTNDSAQLDSIEESKAIKESGLHHIRYRQNTRLGLDGLALAVGSVIAAIRQIVSELEQADGQRLVEVQSNSTGASIQGRRSTGGTAAVLAEQGRAAAQARQDQTPAQRGCDLTWAQWRGEVESRGSSS
ncbi:MAG TPA: DUF5615 family PIN-like protein [Pseudonocardiaceae bacterium]|jgi:1-aminocyclopropane-1-carboxylate deaminase/D-cysteine desulfhydrase-like pyridoxal-dependent ACC family enzyme